MHAAYYTRTGLAREVLEIGDIEMPAPAPGEVRVRVHASGINPSDTKKRAGAPGRAIKEARVIPHCDGAGVIEEIGEGVDPTFWLRAIQREGQQNRREIVVLKRFCL